MMEINIPQIVIGFRPVLVLGNLEDCPQAPDRGLFYKAWIKLLYGDCEIQ